MALWYLSFCDGEKFVGASIIDAADPFDAVMRATALGINKPQYEIGIWGLDKMPDDGEHYLDNFVPADVVRAEGGRSIGEVEAEGTHVPEAACMVRQQMSMVEEDGTETVLDRKKMH